MIKEMRLSDILDLPSIDSDGFADADNLDDENSEWYSLTVSDLMESKTDELEYGGNSSADEYDAIRESMDEHGYNTVPIHVTYGSDLCPAYGTECPDRYRNSLVMGNGHHRVAIALALGHTTMMVTDDLIESGW
jgi:hypothetical protein